MFNNGYAEFCSENTRRAYRRIFNAENYLRFVVKWELVGAHAESWEDSLGDFRAKAREQMDKDAALGLLDVEHGNVLAYTMLNNIKEIMINNENWPIFQKNWAQKNYLTLQFEVFNRLRGKAMHCRPWTETDVRSLDATLTILENLSQSYRRQEQEGEELVPFNKGLRAPLRELLAKLQADTFEGGGSRWQVQSCHRLGLFVKIVLGLRGGAFSRAAPRALFANSGISCFFAAASPQTGRLDLYVPEKIRKATASALVRELLRFTPLDGSLPDDGEEERVDGRIDGLFELPIALPIALRIAAD